MLSTLQAAAPALAETVLRVYSRARRRRFHAHVLLVRARGLLRGDQERERRLGLLWQVLREEAKQHVVDLAPGDSGVGRGSTDVRRPMAHAEGRELEHSLAEVDEERRVAARRATCVQCVRGPMASGAPAGSLSLVRSVTSMSSSSKCVCN
jgi:hypothetical protein